MKFLQLLRMYFRGIKGSAIILAFMMTISMLIGVLTYAKIQYVTSEFNVINSTTIPDAYYVEYFYSIKDYEAGEISNAAETTIKELKEHPSVDNIYPIRVVNPLAYKGYSISIVLYEPGMVETFPALQALGIDFSSNQNGCVLGSKIFSGLKGSEEITLEFYRPEAHTETFEIASHLKYPYKYLSLSTSNTTVTAKDLFFSGDIILMQSTDEVMSKLEGIAEIECNSNFILSLKNGLSEDEKQAVLNEIQKKAKVFPLDEIVDKTEEAVTKQIKMIAPRPIFLLLSAVIAYFSNVILTVIKKEKELAIFYLCGSSKNTCMLVSIIANCLIAFIPVVINCLFILLAPTYDWLGYIDLGGFFITPDAYGLVLGCFAATLAISAITVIATMHKKTPSTFLRGIT